MLLSDEEIEAYEKAELYYEETHPNDYRTSVIATFLFGVFCFAMCMLT